MRRFVFISFVVMFLQVSCLVAKDVVVLYSGGLDSSAVVAFYASKKEYKNIHLLTFDNGCQGHLDLASTKIPEFREKFPNKIFIHRVISVRYIFKKMALADIEDDIVSYGSNLICIGCKMAMHGHAILYALENELDTVADGFAKRQEDFPEQDEACIAVLRELYEQYRINYKNPLYYVAASKPVVKDLLSRFDLTPKSIEPDCLFGGTFSVPKSSSVKKYSVAKKEILVAFLQSILDGTIMTSNEDAVQHNTSTKHRRGSLVKFDSLPPRKKRKGSNE